jgi:hypothetical protein
LNPREEVKTNLGGERIVGLEMVILGGVDKAWSRSGIDIDHAARTSAAMIALLGGNDRTVGGTAKKARALGAALKSGDERLGAWRHKTPR